MLEVLCILAFVIVLLGVVFIWWADYHCLQCGSDRIGSISPKHSGGREGHWCANCGNRWPIEFREEEDNT